MYIYIYAYGHNGLEDPALLSPISPLQQVLCMSATDFVYVAANDSTKGPTGNIIYNIHVI